MGSTGVFPIGHSRSDSEPSLRLNEMGAHARFVHRLLHAVGPRHLDALQQPGHVLAERTHRLESLPVPAHIVGRKAVHRIPILGRHHGHVGDGEELVQLFESGRSTTPAARHHGSPEFARQLALLVEELCTIWLSISYISKIVL